MMKETDRFATDDITWCMAECETDCPRQPRYIRDRAIPHSFSDFSKECMAYIEKGADLPDLPTIKVDEDLISRRELEQRVQVISYQDEWGETVIGEFVPWEDIEDAPNVVPLSDGDVAIWRSDVLGAIAECQDIDDKARYNVLAEVFGKVLELPPAVDMEGMEQ